MLVVWDRRGTERARFPFFFVTLFGDGPASSTQWPLTSEGQKRNQNKRGEKPIVAGMGKPQTPEPLHAYLSRRLGGVDITFRARAMPRNLGRGHCPLLHARVHQVAKNIRLALN